MSWAAMSRAVNPGWALLGGLVIFLFLFLLSVVVGFAQAQAQEAPSAPIRFERLEVDLWPEYDDPRLLVIYRGVLEGLPGRRIGFELPPNAQVHAVAYATDDGRLMNNEWQPLPGEDALVVLFRPNSPAFQLEYYVELEREGSRRRFRFRFPAQGYAIDSFRLTVRQPQGAFNFVGTPPLEPSGLDPEGFAYFSREIRSLPPDAVVEQTVSYYRAGEGPSVARKPAGSSLSWSVWLGAGLIAAGAGALGVMGFLAWQRRRAPVRVRPARGTRPRRSSSRPQPQPRSGRRAPQAQAQARFCVRCGYAFAEEDRFCPRCGRERGRA